MKEQCPKCGNWVEGKKVATFARKMTRGAVKKGSAVATGAAIGSIIPGLGTIVGGAIGLAASALLDDTVNNVADYVEDSVFDETEYEFTCPKCGRSWIEKCDINYMGDTSIDLSNVRNEFAYYFNNKKEILKNENSFDFYWDNLRERTSGTYGVEGAAIQILVAISAVEFGLSHKTERWGILSVGQVMAKLGSEMYAEGKVLELILESLLLSYLKDDKSVDLEIKQKELYNNRPNIFAVKSTWINNDYLLELYERARYKSYTECVEIFHEKEEYEKIIDCLKLLVEELNGSLYKISGYYLLSDYYYFGKDGIATSRAKGFEYAKKCIDWIDLTSDFDENISYHQYWLSCMDRVGLCYLEGNGIEQDFEKAFQYLSKASSLNSAFSSYNLAEMYKNGRGIPKNKHKALEYYQKAFELGIEAANERIAELKSSTDIYTSEEQEYLDEVKMCLEEDNDISPRERRLLDRLRIKLNISEERAKELEESLKSPQLTEDEQEYLEEYKLCLEEDGEISSKERRLLDRLRDKLGISVERAKVLENTF